VYFVWEDDEGKEWDWTAIRGIRGDKHNTHRVQLKLQWADRRNDGSLWHDSWVPLRQCKGVWEWLYQHKMNTSRMTGYWTEWADVVRREYGNSH